MYPEYLWPPENEISNGKPDAHLNGLIGVWVYLKRAKISGADRQ